MAIRKTATAIHQVSGGLGDAIGDRGEIIFELAVTDFSQFRFPLFRPAFLGEKWPTIDYYVELLGVPNASPFFFAQIKTTREPLHLPSDTLEIKIEQKKCARLFRVPGPTYLVGVHEPTQKAFILSIRTLSSQGIYRIPLTYELTPANLQLLHQEVRDFWRSHPNKPLDSHFG